MVLLLACGAVIAGCARSNSTPAMGDTDRTPTPDVTPTGGHAEMKTTASDAQLAVTLYVSYGYDPEPPHEPMAGLNASGWNDMCGSTFCSGMKVERPEAGFYSSADTNIIARQLREMEDAGIGVVVISWWGWGDADLDGVVEKDHITIRYDDTTRSVLDYMKAHHPDMRFALLVEEFWWVFGHFGETEITNHQIGMILDHIWENYYGPRSDYADLAFQWTEEGRSKPLFLASGPFLESHTGGEERMALRSVVFSSFDTADRTTWPAPHYLVPPSPVYEDGVVMIWPRKDEWYLNMERWPHSGQDPMESLRVDPFLTEGVYDQAWRKIIEHERREEINLIWLWAWNSYADYVYVEPDSCTTAQSAGRTLLDKTRFYYGLFRAGEPFKYAEPFLSERCFQQSTGLYRPEHSEGFSVGALYYAWLGYGASHLEVLRELR